MNVVVTQLRQLQSVLNAIARLIVMKRMYEPIIADMHDVLHWLPIQQRIEYELCDLVYKAIHHIAVAYLTELRVVVSTHQGRLRSAARGYECSSEQRHSLWSP